MHAHAHPEKSIHKKAATSFVERGQRVMMLVTESTHHRVAPGRSIGYRAQYACKQTPFHGCFAAPPSGLVTPPGRMHAADPKANRNLLRKP